MSPSALNNVFKEFEKFTLFQRIIGMSSLIYSNDKLQVSRKRLLFSLISIIGNLLIFFYTLYWVRKSITNISDWYWHLKTTYSSVLICGIVASWFRSNKNVDLLNISLSRMKAVDLQMLFLGKELPPTKSNRVTILIYGLLALAYFLKTFTMTSFVEWIQLLILYTPFIVIISFEDNIDRVNSLLLLRFNAIKEHLVQCLRMEAKQAASFIEKLIICHDQLSTSSQDIDEYFWVQVLSLLTVFFIASFCELYAVSIMYRDEALAHKGILLMEKVLWLTVMFIVIARICHQFAAITNEAKNFNTHLYQLMVDDTTHNILNNSKLKLHIAMNREVVFTAHGFLKLDYSLLHSMIASSTTYLVIVLQFSKQAPIDFKEATSEVGNSTATDVPFFLTTLQ